ncbi:ketosteroid isomerase [Aureimonas endophytica]|uniref:Ketosteroid isomerase n=1 Tax=Aureimonas endophytica TaxID=2027858 RepID=A0A916ZS37_9HYPH|nr:nuclear transport factor 2 family protein [Aureimonas endophytica]GGE11518.1 ketosteroid isomerase [Aureimonas endophytica]
MSQTIETLRHLYERFNAKDLDGVLALLAEDVVWANGMDGGHVEGHAGIRDYWTRQWSLVDPHVEPLRFDAEGDGSVLVAVRQTIRDLAGHPIVEKGLKDKTVGHLFRFAGGKVVRFDIRDME